MIPKPGKDFKLRTSYRPISLLNSTGKIVFVNIFIRMKTINQILKHGIIDAHLENSMDCIIQNRTIYEKKLSNITLKIY